jgi:glycosyltransferase involved in cell wall biosynthesis
MHKYIIISPVRNEEDLVERTLLSVVNQTVKPQEWIIVNDGSTDNTSKIIDNYIEKYDWIKKIDLTDRGFYYPGTGVITAVHTGFKQISGNGWDYVVKLDCDVTIEKDYFERILNEFTENQKLGIASGAIHFIDGEKITKEKVQPDIPWGASKIYRRACFNEINGWEPIPGWDLADVLSAQMKGWETKSFDEYKILHYRITGSRRKGLTGGKFLWGRFQYRYGYSPYYIFLKSIYRMSDKPVIISGIAIFAGYLYAAITREKRIYKKEMRQFLRKKQRVYFKNRVLGLFAKN